MATQQSFTFSTSNHPTPLGYYDSLHWKQRSTAYKKKFGDQCARCGISNWLAKIFYREQNNVHHLNYDYWQERDRDLLCLCRRCHEREHYGLNGGGTLQPLSEIVTDIAQMARTNSKYALVQRRILKDLS